MKTEDYNVGDRVMSEYNETIGYGTIIEKKIVLIVRWDNEEITPENGLTIRLALSKIRDDKLKQLGI